METYIIAGLGNPDKKYEETRHNTGFKAVDALAEKLQIRIKEEKFKSLTGSGYMDGIKILLMKPQTYMNNSGEAVKAAADYFGIDTDHIIILFDDINFSCGRMRVRGKGSAGGHNGMKSIIAHLQSEEFKRVRIGVGNLKVNEDLVNHVLGTFSKEEKAVMEKAYDKAAEAAISLIKNGVEATMSAYNGLDLAPKKEDENV